MPSSQTQLVDQLQVQFDRVNADLMPRLLAAQRAGRDELSPDEERLVAERQVLSARLADAKADAARGELPTNLLGREFTDPTGKRPAMSLVVNEARTYAKGDPRRSFLQDLARQALNRDHTGEARDRLMRHAREVETAPEYAEYRALDRQPGTGGDLVPPIYLMDEVIEVARPGRAFANLVQRQPLPQGTDSINIPKIVTGTTVGIQNGDNTAPSETDLTDGLVNAPVQTLAGQQSVAVQLIDQSPIAFDELIFRDLIAAHAAATDVQVILGSGSNGQVLGVHNTPGITSLTPAGGEGVTDVAQVYKVLAKAISSVHTSRYLSPEVIVMHPERWGWLTAQLDSQDRPLFVPNANAPQNAAGILEAVASQQVVGNMQGLPIVTDPGIPTNLGGSGTVVGTEDAIYVARTSDLVLWESGIRARALPETKGGTLTVLLQVYSYLAFTAARYPQSVVEITGLPAITF